MDAVRTAHQNNTSISRSGSPVQSPAVGRKHSFPGGAVVDGEAFSNSRAVFISDTHLGCPHARTDRLLRFLSTIRPEYLYLVGDFIDGWELRRRWNWPPEVTEVFRRLVGLSRAGTTIRYAIGNHDDFLRENPLLRELVTVEGVDMADEFVHVTADGRRFLIIHGDHFDHYGNCSATFEWLASLSYNALLAGNGVWHRWFGGRDGVVSTRVRSSMKSLRRHRVQFRSLLAAHAAERGFDGVVCGHIHAPEQVQIDGVEYCNTGDWLENFTAIIEQLCGNLNLQSPGIAAVA